MHISSFDPQAALRGVGDKAEIPSQTSATRKNGGRGATCVVSSSPLERARREAVGFQQFPFWRAPESRSVAVGPGLIPSSLHLEAVPPLAPGRSPAAPQPEVEMEALGPGEAMGWARTQAPGPVRTGWAPV